MKLIKTFSLITVVLIILSVISLTLINGSFLNKTYLEPWNTSYYKQFDDIRLQIISHAILAPNAHNKQSWKILLGENSNEFTLYLDEKRLLNETDPFHRQSIISHGTFLELVKISANKLGYDAEIDFFPKGEIDDIGSIESIINKPIAKITLNKININEHILYKSIFDRVTTRTPYLDKPLTKHQLNEITNVNDFDGINIIIFQSGEDLEKIKSLALSGVELESKNIGALQETNDVFRSSEYEKNEYRDGITLSSQGYSFIKEFFLEGVSTLFPVPLETEGKIWYNGAKERIPKTPAYIMILSNKNDRTTQVKVGMLYSRIQLLGTSLNLGMQPTMQVTQEYSKMSELYNEINKTFTKNGQTIQMLFRVGESSKKVKHSPRRDVMDLLK